MLEGLGETRLRTSPPAIQFHTGNLKALANNDTLLRTNCCRHKCFPVCPRAQHLLRTQILCPGLKKKMFLILFTNSLCPQQMFSSLRSQGNIIGDNASATMCPSHGTRDLTKGNRSATTMKTVSGKLGRKKSISCYMNLVHFGGKHRMGFSLGILF